ncbi:hypothetical protein QVD17_27791 [Tagetes erecta]|uniref:Uncharacterized protein n=1 Tax=Tagetes erecta TaxID=13708 RepID=A0AAD8KCK7_TARER|nr:hypothetical protein QVD17_27791 [Tagetes erecta]
MIQITFLICLYFNSSSICFLKCRLPLFFNKFHLSRVVDGRDENRDDAWVVDVRSADLIIYNKIMPIVTLSL